MRDLNIRSFQVLRIELFRLMLNYLTFSFHDSQLFSFSFSFFKHDFSFNFNPSFSNIFNPRSPLSVSFHFRFSPQLEVYCNFSRVYEYRNGAKIDTLPTLHPAMESTQLSNPIIYAYIYMYVCFASKSCYSCLVCTRAINPLHFLFPVFLTGYHGFAKLKCLQGCGRAGYAC